MRQTIRWLCRQCEGSGYMKVWTQDGREWPAICDKCKGKGTISSYLALTVARHD